MDYIYDTETFPNCFLFCAASADGKERHVFEISHRRNDSAVLSDWLIALKAGGHRMVGFNNLGFDYPVLHTFIRGARDCSLLYNKAMQIINCENKFEHLVYPSDRCVPQIDLLKLHHFDNKARLTSLKALEFNMRRENVSNLPFPPGTVLTPDHIDVLRSYCWDDVDATLAFYEQSLEKIRFREQLLAKAPDKDFLNYSDVKIGKTIFETALEASGVPCYSFGPSGRQPRQTQRVSVKLADCIPNYVTFDHPEFNRILSYFKQTTITQTKGAFNDLIARVGGLDFKFGTGGLHASVDNESFVESDTMMIYDVDVTSLYPSIAIENNYYPEHLGPGFVEVYRQLRSERIKYPKSSSENAALKLALNGVYGASNDPFSCFFDPLFTMRITITGQLVIAMLAEQLLSLSHIRIIQCNTDGITLYMPRTAKFIVDAICQRWEKLTRLSLEYVEFERMAVADVNSYLAVKKDGGVKRKGRYEYALELHKDASALVVPKVAEKVILEGVPILDTLKNWPDKMDFMCRAKVDRNTKLLIDMNGIEYELDRLQRYFVSTEGGQLLKLMKPLAKKPGEYRRIGICSGWKVTPCNDLRKLPDGPLPIDYRWYADEVEKLVAGVI